ncbi:hypothetical protein OF83DRAFT_267416 [Amylostereum chailletii]|nr:hypothetical protein OF83DRAFT_267416 [Amylostereum chailletii]
MQEMVMNAHLAWKSGRTYVMYNYTWDRHADGDYSHFGDTLIPARIPITALAAGPIAGGPFPASDPTPPAVTTEFFEKVCPHPTLVNVQETKGDELEWASASTMMEGFSAKLRNIEDNCIELQEDTSQVFDFWIFGDGPRMMDFWPEIMQSPILTEWAWSSLVVSGVEANRKKIHPAITKKDRHRAPLPGLIALHIRRGDFEGHCEHLAKWTAAFNAFNVRPDYPDQHVAPEGGGGGENTPEGFAFYKQHCFPDIDQIVEKVMDIRTESKTPLDRIFILTNAKRDWLDELDGKFRAKAVWKSITTSRDMEVTWEQKFVAQSMDMLIATRAEVFVGNGWSSLTSNINMLRISQFHPPSKSHFW